MSTTTTTSAPPSKAQAVQAMFDRIAGTYDLLNDCMTLGLHRHWKNKAAEKLQLTTGNRVIDVCTGTGDFIRNLSPRVGETGEIMGVDFSEEMLVIARERFSSTRNARFQRADALALPFEDSIFDGAIVGFGLRNVSDIRQAVSEMRRVVKPGGWVVNLDTAPSPTIPGFWEIFSHIMPVVGGIISKDPEAYRYLASSTQNFLTPKELAIVFEGVGLTNVQHQSLAFGTVSIQAGQVPK